MITQDSIDSLRGATIYDNDGDKIGKVGEVYLDDSSGEPAWLTVTTGLFGSAQTFVPLQEASMNGADVSVPYTKATIKDAPRVSADGHLDISEEDALFEYYGVGKATGAAAPSGVGSGFDGQSETFEGRTTREAAGYRSGEQDVTPTGYREGGYRDGEGLGGREGVTAGADTDLAASERGTVGHDTSGPTTDTAMTRSEEQLRVGTETRERGRARLRKYVVTEQQTVTVPVSHEEVRLETEPITDANVSSATDGPAISEEEHEVILREEVPVVSKETRPVERVRATTETVTDEQSISEEVRKERIDMDRDGLGDRIADDNLADDSLGESRRSARGEGFDERPDVRR